MKRAVVTFLLIFVTMGWAVAQNNPYRINDKLYDYYMECRSHIDEPIVLNMLDTLNHRAAAVGDVKAQCMAHTARVDYYYAIKNIEWSDNSGWVDKLPENEEYLKYQYLI